MANTRIDTPLTVPATHAQPESVVISIDNILAPDDSDYGHIVEGNI